MNLWYIRTNWNPGQGCWEWAIHEGIPVDDPQGRIVSNKITSDCNPACKTREHALLMALGYCQACSKINECRVVF